MRLALTYSLTNENLNGNPFDPNRSNQLLFQCLRFIPPQQAAEISQGRLLNGRAFWNLLWRKKIYNFIISSYELDSAKLSFLFDFFFAPRKFIALFDQATQSWGNYIEVVSTQTDFPISYIEDLILLPEVNFIFEEVLWQN